MIDSEFYNSIGLGDDEVLGDDSSDTSDNPTSTDNKSSVDDNDSTSLSDDDSIESLVTDTKTALILNEPACDPVQIQPVEPLVPVVTPTKPAKPQPRARVVGSRKIQAATFNNTSSDIICPPEVYPQAESVVIEGFTLNTLSVPVVSTDLPQPESNLVIQVPIKTAPPAKATRKKKNV